MRAPLIVLILICSAAFAQTVYVSNGPGGQVLAVDISQTPATSTPFTLKDLDSSLKNVAPWDITVGPDNKLYLCAPGANKIVRFDPRSEASDRLVETVFPAPTAKNPPLLAPRSPRFDAFGNLLVTGLGGVYRFAGVANIPQFDSRPTAEAVLSLGGTLLGLAFTNQGDLLIVDGGSRRAAPQILRATFSCGFIPPVSCSYSSATPLITSGLISPVGIARNSTGQIFVADRGTGKIEHFSSDGSQLGTFATFSSGQSPFYLRFAADDTLYVATADASQHSGVLWKLNPAGGTPGLVLDLGDNYPAIGVALPGTSKVLCTSGIGIESCATKQGTVDGLRPPLTGTPQTFNFGPHGLQLTAGTSDAECNIKITANQRPPADVNSALSTLSLAALPESGQEGWVTTYLVEEGENGTHCPRGPDGKYDFTLFGYLPHPTEVFARIVSCDSGPTNCKDDVLNFGYYPYGVLPGDPLNSGKGDHFSEYLMTNGLAPLAQLDTFCGFQPPLKTNPNLSPATIKGGSDLTVKFQLASPGGTCSSGPFDRGAAAYLSAQFLGYQEVPDNFAPMIVTPSGSSNDEPIFRIDTTGTQYLYNLNTTNPNDGTPWLSGTYLLTVSSGSFYPRSVCICVNKCSKIKEVEDICRQVLQSSQ